MLNSVNQNFQFKIDNMKNNSINFLDSTIFINKDNSLLSMKHYKKPTKSDVLTNFSKSICPKSHKNNCIIGSVNRIMHASSDKIFQEPAIEKLKKKLKRNSYPSKLINSKIDLALKNEKRKEPEYDEEIYLSLDYTSHQCNLIQKQLLETIRKFLPKFRLKISWKSIRISNLINPRLKPSQNRDNPTACIYKFTCPCNNGIYIGETLRPVVNRLKEHNFRSSNSEISTHIYNCEIYQTKLKTENKYNLTPKKKLEFLLSHTSILKSNLFDCHKRKYTEAFFINILLPNLNKQNNHRKIKFI